MVHFETRMNASRFVVINVKVQGHTGLQHLENTLLAWLMRYLENYWTEFHQTFSVDALWDKDEHFSVCGQRSKVKVAAGGGIQISTLCVEF